LVQISVQIKEALWQQLRAEAFVGTRANPSGLRISAALIALRLEYLHPIIDLALANYLL
jgi:hypothetical protein